MSIETVAKLKALKLHGMQRSWAGAAAQARHSEFDPERFMGQLLAAERAEREVRSTAYQMSAARFPPIAIGETALRSSDGRQAHLRARPRSSHNLLRMQTRCGHA